MEKIVVEIEVMNDKKNYYLIYDDVVINILGNSFNVKDCDDNIYEFVSLYDCLQFIINRDYEYDYLRTKYLKGVKHE